MKTPVIVELFYSGVWNDVTADVRTSDSIVITRGRPLGGPRIRPTRCDLSFNNADSKYSPRNPESPLYGLIARNTPIRVRVGPTVQDTFARTETNAWGSADTDQAWTLTGTAANFDVAAGVGTIVGDVGGEFATTGSFTDLDMLCMVRASTLNGEVGLVARFTDTNNHYTFEIDLDSGSQDLTIGRVSGGIPAVLATTAFTAVAGTWYWIRTQCEGTALRMKAWEDGDPEPAGWQLETADSTHTSGAVGCASWNATGVKSFDDLTVFRGLTRVDLDAKYRFVGEVESWPVRSRGAAKDVWAPVRAWGVTRRLGNAGSEADKRSALRRFYDDASPQPVAYWPMTTPANLATGGDAMVTTATDSGGAVVQEWENATVANWLESGVQLSPLLFITPPSAIAATTVAAIDMVAVARPIEAGAGSWGLMVADSAENTVGLIFAAWVDGVPTLQLHGGGGPAVDTGSASDAAKAWDNAPHHWRILLEQNGADIDLTVYIDGVEVMSGTDTTAALSEIKPLLFTNNGINGAAGHLVQWDDTPPSVTDAATAALGHTGEEAHDRFTRLSTEEGLSSTVDGDESAAMGPQHMDPPLELLFEAADSDDGILLEARDELGVEMRTLESLLNQTLAANPDYAAGQVWRLDPNENTDDLANIVTVVRRDGSEFTVERTDGTLGTTTVGDYPVRVELSLNDDTQCLQQAAWRSHVGTWDEARIENLGVHLTRLIEDGQDSLAGDVLDADVGDTLQISNRPDWAGHLALQIIVDGYVEELGSHSHTIEFHGPPARPYAVGVLDTTRIDVPEGTTVAEALDTTETGVTVSAAVFSSSATPYTVEVGGERMTVTSVSGSTLTVTRSINGVTKSHDNGAAIHVASPLRLARGA